MKKSKLVKSLLIISGIIGIAIGSALLFAPVAFEASADIHIGDNVNLLSEIKAPGGALLVAGILIMLGVFIPRMTYTSIVLSSLFYLSYGLSRSLSMIIDGIPHDSLIMATVAELTIGLFSLLALFNFQKKQNN